MTSRFKPFAQPLDRAAIVLMLLLSLVIGLVLLKGDRTAPHIRDFSWQNKQVGAEDTAFILGFSRPMDHASVEANLRIDPPLAGKVSWAGRRMAYTLESPAPYGTQFQMQLQGARDRFSPPDDPRTQMQPFVGQFHSRDRAFVYLGVQGEEAGRLVLYNLTQQKQQILTPPDLVVMDFEPYPYGDRILFAANDRTSQQENLLNQQLYTVSTGIQIQAGAQDPGEAIDSTAVPPTQTQPAGTIEQVLDSQNYQNLKFDLAPDGQKIVVQRVNRNNPADFGIWVLQAGQSPQPLGAQPGGDFLIAPDSKSLAFNQGQGVAILPLEPGGEALDFLSQFGQTLSFARDGSAAAMIQFNAVPGDPTRSLFFVSSQGAQKELLKTDGSILSAQFHPTRPLLYCLYTRLIPGDDYLEQPYLAAIDWQTAKVTDLLMLPIQRDVQVSLAPDGLGILFDQIVDAPAAEQDGIIRSSEGKAIADSHLWLLPLATDNDGNPVQAEPESLPLPGLRPRWLP
jgi:hypothetical protein